MKRLLLLFMLLSGIACLAEHAGPVSRTEEANCSTKVSHIGKRSPDDAIRNRIHNSFHIAVKIRRVISNLPLSLNCNDFLRGDLAQHLVQLRLAFNVTCFNPDRLFLLFRSILI